jgi:hypothetical protein
MKGQKKKKRDSNSRTENVVESTEYVRKILELGRCDISYCRGKFDDNQVVIEYLSPPIRYRKTKQIIKRWKVYDYEVYEGYIVDNRMYIGHQREWDNLVFDTFNVEVDEQFVNNMEKVFEKHSWIKSVFTGTSPKNHFSRAWPLGLYNIQGVIITARLIGKARDLLYDSFEDPSECPISACIGKHGTKDCLYKINQQIYPDFNIEKGWVAEHFNISELLKYENFSEKESVKYIVERWAAKLDNFYRRWGGNKDSDAKDEIKKLAQKTISGTSLSYDDKEMEKNELLKYQMY